MKYPGQPRTSSNETSTILIRLPRDRSSWLGFDDRSKDARASAG